MQVLAAASQASNSGQRPHCKLRLQASLLSQLAELPAIWPAVTDLHGRDGALLGRGDALLQASQVGGQRGLVPHS